MKITIVRTLGAAGSFYAAVFVFSIILSFPAWAADVIVKIDNFTFNPPSLAIKAGAGVTWENHDDIPHTVVSTTQVFRSKPLDTDDKFSFTFTIPGTYQYFCSLHPHMTGTIVVEATPGNNAPK